MIAADLVLGSDLVQGSGSVLASGAVQASEPHCKIFSGCGFPAPGLHSFHYEPLWGIEFGPFALTKPVLLVLIITVLIAIAITAAFRKAKLVPRGFQNVVELFYDFIRIGICRDVIGKGGEKWAPYLATLFLFIFFMNFMGIVPGAQIAPTSITAFTWPFAIMSYLIMWAVGIKHQGFGGYVKNALVPPGAPTWVLPILSPIELLSTFVFRPVTLAVRLFANMFAGHILILIFTLATEYWLIPHIAVAVSGVSFAMVLVLTVFELVVQVLQAYIFTVLTASYIGEAMHGH